MSAEDHMHWLDRQIAEQTQAEEYAAMEASKLRLLDEAVAECQKRGETT